MNKITVFTPTYNREKTLHRAYESLLGQTFRDFDWLIIDDGSKDNTRQLVEKWIGEKKIPIRYYTKENGGKYTAMLLAKKYLSADWVVTLDSDDEFTKDALFIFNNQIEAIASLPANEAIVEIRARCMLPDGTGLGNWLPAGNEKYFDATWHQWTLERKIYDEMVSCILTDVFKEVVSLPDDLWLKGKFRYFSEATFWARLSKRKIRHLTVPLRIYHLDSSNSILRNTTSNTGFYDDLIFAKYFLSENLGHFFKRPSYFINLLLKYHIAAWKTGVGSFESFSHADGWRFKLLWVLSLLPAFTLNIYYKFVRKAYWR